MRQVELENLLHFCLNFSLQKRLDVDYTFCYIQSKQQDHIDDIQLLMASWQDQVCRPTL